MSVRAQVYSSIKFGPRRCRCCWLSGQPQPWHDCSSPASSPTRRPERPFEGFRPCYRAFRKSLRCPTQSKEVKQISRVIFPFIARSFASTPDSSMSPSSTSSITADCADSSWRCSFPPGSGTSPIYQGQAIEYHVISTSTLVFGYIHKLWALAPMPGPVNCCAAFAWASASSLCT